MSLTEGGTAYEWFRMKTRFEADRKGNLELAYFIFSP